MLKFTFMLRKARQAGWSLQKDAAARCSVLWSSAETCSNPKVFWLSKVASGTCMKQWWAEWVGFHCMLTTANCHCCARRTGWRSHSGLKASLRWRCSKMWLEWSPTFGFIYLHFQDLHTKLTVEQHEPLEPSPPAVPLLSRFWVQGSARTGQEASG